jgi:hypothetical protein
MKVGVAIRISCLFNLALHTLAQIRVMAPASLVQNFKDSQGRIDGSTATFGAPFYGERLLGRLVWADPGNHSHCRKDDYHVPRPEEIKHGSYGEVRLIHIIMVRRGKCSFVTKVRIAREKGAHAVIIVDKEDSKLESSDIQRIIVADDGYGDKVKIPSMLISRKDGALLIDAARRSTPQVIVELAWDVPTGHVVIMDLWMSSASRDSQKFLKEFKDKRLALNEAVKFVPHYHVFGMQSAVDYNNLCWANDAQYCTEDPDGSGPITGKMVLEEDIRQLCIHERTKVTRISLDDMEKGRQPVEYAEKFWMYVEKFADECPIDGPEDDPEHAFGTICSERVQHDVGINDDLFDDVKKCYRETQLEKLKAERENIAWSPHALRINGWRYSGTMDADLVTRAVCAGFVKQPKACEDLVQPINPYVDEQVVEEDTGVGLGTFVTALLVIAGITGSALLLYKRSLTRHIHSALREEVMLEVQAQMDSYKPCPSS